MNQPGFATPTRAGSLRYLAPECIIDSNESDDDNTFTTKKSDVYAFSMVGVMVSLFQITHILGFDGYYHRFCLDNIFTPTYVTRIGSSLEFQMAYDQEGKNINCPNYMPRYGTFLSSAGFRLLRKGVRCQSLYSN